MAVRLAHVAGLDPENPSGPVRPSARSACLVGASAAAVPVPPALPSRIPAQALRAGPAARIARPPARRRLPGRTDQQCMGRWRRHVDPSLRKESWDEEEDDLLTELVEELGGCWSSCGC